MAEQKGDISRRDFLKHLAAGAIGAGLFGLARKADAIPFLKPIEATKDPEKNRKREGYYRHLLIREVIDEKGEKHPTICVTLDDGPSPHTPEILEMLSRLNIKAVFFPTGDNVKACPGKLREVAAGGHEIGNHTMHHNELPAQISRGQTFEDIWSGQIEPLSALIEKETGKRPTSFRFPSMKTGPKEMRLVESMGKKGFDVLDSSAYNGDWIKIPKQEGDKEKQRNEFIARLRATIRSAGGGAIVLLHEINTQTRAMLESELQKLKNDGYIFLTARQGLGRDPLPSGFHLVT